MRCQRDLRELKKSGCAYADLADGDTPATPAAGGRHQAGHYTVTGGVHHHGLYRLRPFTQQAQCCISEISAISVR